MDNVSNSLKDMKHDLKGEEYIARWQREDKDKLEPKVDAINTKMETEVSERYNGQNEITLKCKEKYILFGFIEPDILAACSLRLTRRFFSLSLFYQSTVVIIGQFERNPDLTLNNSVKFLIPDNGSMSIPAR